MAPCLGVLGYMALGAPILWWWHCTESESGESISAMAGLVMTAFWPFMLLMLVIDLLSNTILLKPRPTPPPS